MSKPNPTDATKVDQIEARVRGAFLELALQVGGIVAEHPIPDPAVVTLCRCVEKAFRGCLEPLADMRAPVAPPPPFNLRKHPAILHLLDVIKIQH
ncbi:MAG: hypothetical protein Q8O14_14855 [bacterium]|nr:hypothetical protein [bacterium]